MSNKRKGHKGRLLRTGESQRGDLIYQYRYTDLCGKRRSIYDSDLQGLRRKEKELQRQLDDGIDYEAGQITVLELLKRYVSLKQGVRHNTRMGYKFVLNLAPHRADRGAAQDLDGLHPAGRGYKDRQRHPLHPHDRRGVPEPQQYARKPPEGHS